MAESNIIVKRSPKCHPVANNAIAMTTGAAILLAVSFVTGERHGRPTDVGAWAALAYVSLAGTVAVFTLFIYVVQRWTASATSYVMLLMPLVTIGAAWVVLGQAVTPAFGIGGALVIAGVYVGVLGRQPAVGMSAPSTSSFARSTAQPGCA